MMNNPRTVEDILIDFKGRRAGIIKALTKDVEELYRLCDPNSLSLCLYGFPNQTWELNLPSFSELPQPRLGINLTRDSMTRQEWLSMVAFHTEAWLHSVAAYFAAKFKLDKADRKRLFNKITDVSSISEAMNGASRKRARREGEGDGLLPQDMLFDILAKLPVRDLLRYRSVCKSWLALIDNPDFASAHLNNYKSNCEGSHLLVIERPRSWLKKDQALVRRSDTFRKLLELEFLDGDGDGGSCELISYINGVMLVRKGNLSLLREILLWNPSLHRFRIVPNSVFETLREATYFELGFGFDASSDDYKVIAIIYFQAEFNCNRNRYRGTVPSLVQVYSLSSNSWSTNLGVDPPPYWSVGRQVFINGAINWTSLGPEPSDEGWQTKRDSHIVSLDVSNEVFKYFELPKEIVSPDEPLWEKFPVVMEGSLAIFCNYECHIDIWVMEEYGVTNSWNKRYKFALQFDNLLHFKNNGELLFAIEGKGMKSYDVKRKWLRDLAKTYSRSSKYTVYTYIESLVLFKV